MQGLYINLDRSERRRSRFEAEQARFGLSGAYKRVRAVQEVEPMRGCWQSHIKAMHAARQLGGIVHIVEDDVILSDAVAPFLASPELAGLLERFDIIYLSMWVDPEPLSMRPYLAALAERGDRYAYVDMLGVRVGAMDSYVVAPRSLAKVARLMGERLARPPLMANDGFIDSLVKARTLKAAAIVPFLSCIDIDTGTQSTLQYLGRDEQTRFVKLRTSFFVDRDRQESFPLPGDDRAPTAR
jgi:GR25 family glycosyltransferase involved in LPS biosynthesis